MIRSIRVWLWSLVAEMEYALYPWKKKNPPQWAVDRYKLDSGMMEDIDNEYLYFDWLKSQEQKIQKIEENIIFIIKELRKLKNEK
jgi:hypothetical protein